MKNVAKILYLVAAILGFVEFGGSVIGGIVCIAMGGIAAATASSNTNPEAATVAAGTLIGVGVFLLIYMAIFLIAGIMAIKGRKALYANSASTGIHIANIVFGALTLGAIQIAPAVLSLIVTTRENNSGVIDATGE
ncbi:MAG: hypothetical protein K6B65_03320 [Bacilli bacterium]|nr:hypothetical protein [Bacilli bacterium]